MNLWQSSFTPMLLKEISKVFDSDAYLYELKYDGMRALIFATPTKIIIKNRHNEDITNLYPELQNIKKLVSQKTIFDGEIVIFKNNHPNFSELQKRSHLKNQNKINYASIKTPVIYMCFDILYQDEDLTNKPLLARKKILNKVKDNNYFAKVKYYNAGKILFSFVKKNQLEGIVAKKKDSVYEINNRSSSWIKIKNMCHKTFYIGGYIESFNTISLILGEYRKNILYYVGRVVVSKKNSKICYLMQLKPIKNPFQDYDSNGVFIRPFLTCKVKYMEMTSTNHLRQAVFISFTF
jgi:bifunctional non-homologous end joining protein LigD